MWIWLSTAFAGLGPLDTMVVFNADSPEAVEVAEHYASERSLPAGHRCGVKGLDPATTSIDVATFETSVRGPLEACLASLPDPDEIDVLVTVRGLPYLVTTDAGSVGFEAALQVHHATDQSGDEIVGQVAGNPAARVPNPAYAGAPFPCDTADLTVENQFSGSYRASCSLTRENRLPRSFSRGQEHAVSGWTFTDNLFVVGRLDGFDFDDARALVDRSVASDDNPPDGELMCMHGGDAARGARDPECEYTVRRLAEVGANATWVPDFDGALSGRRLAAYFTGAVDIREAIPDHEWLPGAIACNLTSFGARPNNFFCDETGKTCPANESQTSVARFVRAGATGAHGTVAEPYNNSFPDASTLLLYHEGYTLGESFLYSSKYLYWYNLVLGDPLAAPFAARPVISVDPFPIEGDPLVVTATHPDGISRLALYVDGALEAEADGPELTWDPELLQGESVDVLVVAEAGIAVLGRPTYDGTATPPTGWDLENGEQRVRANPQGWQEVSVVVAGPIVDGPPGGCGCASGGGAPWVPVLLGLLVFPWRRRLR